MAIARTFMVEKIVAVPVKSCFFGTMKCVVELSEAEEKTSRQMSLNPPASLHAHPGRGHDDARPQETSCSYAVATAPEMKKA